MGPVGAAQSTIATLALLTASAVCAAGQDVASTSASSLDRRPLAELVQELPGQVASLDDLVRVALERNLPLEATRLRRRLAEAGVDVEGGDFDLGFTLGADVTRNRQFSDRGGTYQATAADIHWHSEDVAVYVMKGETYFLDGETGKKHAVMAGDKVTVPARTLHAEGEVVGGIIYLIGLPEALSPERFLMQRDASELSAS